MNASVLWWPFIKKHSVAGVLLLVVGVITSYCTLLLPLSIGKFFEISFGQGGNKTRALQLLYMDMPGEISSFVQSFLLIMLVKFAGNWSYQYYASMLGESFVAELRSQLLNYYLQQPITERESLLIPFGNDVKNMQQLVVKGLLGLVKDILFLAMGLYVLFALQATITGSVLVFMLLFYGINRWLNLANKPAFATKRKRQATLLNHATRMLANKQQICENDQLQLKEKADQLQVSLTRYHAIKSLLSALTPFLLYAMLAAIMVIITWGIGSKNLQPETVIVYVLLLMTLFPTIRNIIRIEHTWIQGKMSAAKFIKAAISAKK